MPNVNLQQHFSKYFILILFLGMVKSLSHLKFIGKNIKKLITWYKPSQWGEIRILFEVMREGKANAHIVLCIAGITESKNHIIQAIQPICIQASSQQKFPEILIQYIYHRPNIIRSTIETWPQNVWLKANLHSIRRVPLTSCWNHKHHICFLTQFSLGITKSIAVHIVNTIWNFKIAKILNFKNSHIAVCTGIPSEKAQYATKKFIMKKNL